jgi:hypothetical protein
LGTGPGTFFTSKWASILNRYCGQNGDNRTEDGLLLLHKKGKGYYIYNSLSLFRTTASRE